MSDSIQKVNQTEESQALLQSSNGSHSADGSSMSPKLTKESGDDAYYYPSRTNSGGRVYFPNSYRSGIATLRQ